MANTMAKKIPAKGKDFCNKWSENTGIAKISLTTHTPNPCTLVDLMTKVSKKRLTTFWREKIPLKNLTKILALKGDSSMSVFSRVLLYLLVHCQIPKKSWHSQNRPQFPFLSDASIFTLNCVSNPCLRDHIYQLLKISFRQPKNLGQFCFWASLELAIYISKSQQTLLHFPYWLFTQLFVFTIKSCLLPYFPCLVACLFDHLSCPALGVLLGVAPSLSRPVTIELCILYQTTTLESTNNQTRWLGAFGIPSKL